MKKALSLTIIITFLSISTIQTVGYGRSKCMLNMLNQKLIKNRNMIDITNITKAIHQGIDQKLNPLMQYRHKKASPALIREFFIATSLKKFIKKVPELVQIAAVFHAEGGLSNENKTFNFEIFLQAIDHCAIRCTQDFAKILPMVFRHLGLSTKHIDYPEYDFIPTGKPLTAQAYYSPSFKLFASTLHIDLLPKEIANQVLHYYVQIMPHYQGRLMELAQQTFLTQQEGLEYAWLLATQLLEPRPYKPLKEYSPKLYFLCKKMVPEIFNGLLVGPEINHFALDLRKAGVCKWGYKSPTFRSDIDKFWRDIQAWGFTTLESVEGDLHNPEIKIRQTSIKMEPQHGETPYYIEFVTRCPLDPDIKGKAAQEAPVYEGFLTSNANTIYTSNRSEKVREIITAADYQTLRKALALEFLKAEEEFYNPSQKTMQ